ncbi:MAG TPA: macrolide family glycosyltransferase [Ktedonobacterales bacterium]|jgi:MGT family glycosyltransferase
MATAAFFNIPFYGHMNPTLPLVAELTRRGDHITYYSSETFRSAIAQAGAAFRGIDTFFTERTPVDANLVRFAYTLIRATQQILPSLLDEVRANPPDYIVFDSLCIWGRCVAEILRVPAVASISALARPHSPMQREIVVNMLSMLPSSVRMLVAGRRELRKFNEIAEQLRAMYHIPKMGIADAYNNLADLNIVYSIKELQAWPNTFDERFTFVGPFLDGRAETATFPFEELGKRPVIYISLGTVFNANDDFYRHCFEAFADLDRRVVLSIGDKTDLRHLGAIPDNFIVRPFVPQLQVLRRAALFITHGGMNSVNEGLFMGVPLLMVPQGADQFFIARRLQRLGVGKTLDSSLLSADRLRRAAAEILANPSFHQQCERLSVALHQAGGPTAAADAIDAFKRQHGLVS